MKKDYIYLNSYIIQKDMRIRLPKQILKILNLENGVSYLDFYIDNGSKTIILKPVKKRENNDDKK